MHYVKIVGIRSFSGPYFPAFGLNTERYSVSLRIRSECRKIRTRKSPNTGTFDAVIQTEFLESGKFPQSWIHSDKESKMGRKVRKSFQTSKLFFCVTNQR